MTRPAERIRDKALAEHPGATVAGRGRNWIAHNLGGNKGRWTGKIGPLHFGPGPYDLDAEIDTAWRPGELPDQPWLWKMTKADYNVYFGPGTEAFNAGQIIKYVDPASQESVTFQPLQLQWTNDLDQIAAIGNPQPVTPTIDDDQLTFAGAFGPGLDFRWTASTTRLSKALTVASPGAIGSPPEWMNPAGLALKLQFVFQVGAQVEILVDGQPWNKNTHVTTFDHVEFQVQGQPAWWFNAPRAFGAGPEPAPPTIPTHLRKTGNNLIVEVRVPWTWLQDAAYPVTVDPQVDYEVAASSDDAFETVFGAVDLTNTALSFGNYGIGRHNGCRFLSVTLPSGCTIDSAYWQIYSNGNQTGTDVYGDLYCEDNSTPATFTTTTNDLTNRTRTTASVAWDTPASWSNNTWYNLPDMKTCVQELVDSYDYSSGADMAFLYIYDSGNDERNGDSYDEAGAYEPELEINYTSGGEPEPASLLALLGVGG